MRSSYPLLAGLVDDAALFPPGNAPMDVALAEHARHRSSWYADLAGPFLCAASRVDELAAALTADQHIELSVVVDVSEAQHAWRDATTDPRISLVAVEARHAKLGDDAVAIAKFLKSAAGVTGFLEVPRTDFEAGLDLVAGSGWHAAKYRTGGTTPDAFPTEAELAKFLLAVTERDLPFKLTAGLHHAVRGTDPATGFEQHGILNVFVATRVALAGGSVADVAVVLAQRDATPMVEMVAGWDARTCADVRHAFRSFGCCGVTDPIDDLVALGLLEASR